jgi:hypothetical protein
LIAIEGNIDAKDAKVKSIPNFISSKNVGTFHLTFDILFDDSKDILG